MIKSSEDYAIKRNHSPDGKFNLGEFLIDFATSESCSNQMRTCDPVHARAAYTVRFTNNIFIEFRSKVVCGIHSLFFSHDPAEPPRGAFLSLRGGSQVQKGFAFVKKGDKECRCVLEFVALLMQSFKVQVQRLVRWRKT